MRKGAIIISQGDELVSGRIQDTNASWVCGELWDAGIEVLGMRTVPDSEQRIKECLEEVSARAEVIICTGGLGPTDDDLTARAAAAAAGRPLVEDMEALASMEAHYAGRGRAVPGRSRKMALLPESAEALRNRLGSAPGFRMELNGSVLFFLPGVPEEMRRMFEEEVSPRLPLPSAKTVVELGTMGLAESLLAERLDGLEHGGLQLGYVATRRGNTVKLRFSGEPDGAVIQEAERRLGKSLFGRGCTDLAAAVGAALARRGETLALAESCTAGSLAAWVASVPGASRYLLEGAVVYSNAAKIRACGVEADTISEHGAVSRPVALQLASGIRNAAGSDWGIGITGIAGPGGGSPGKPVGTVHVSVAGTEALEHRAFRFHGTRSQIMDSSAAHALLMLHHALHP